MVAEEINTDLNRYGSIDVHVRVWRGYRHDERVSCPVLKTIFGLPCSPPTDCRVDGNMATTGQFGGETAPYIRVNRTIGWTADAEIPTAGFPCVILIIILVSVMRIDAQLKLSEAFGSSNHLEAEAVRGVTVLSVPPPFTGARFNKIRQRDPHSDRRVEWQSL